MTSTLAPADTKTRILDAAERIFSEDGFDAASLRTITAAAQVNLAAVNYHFHSKESLFCAVIERRVDPINRRRLEMLDAIHGKPTPEKIMEAFLRPPMEMCSGEASAVRTLVARMHSVPGELFRRIMKENFVTVLNRFVEALEVALPQAAREELQWRMFFVIGSMSQALAWGPLIAEFTSGTRASVDNDVLTARLVSFGAAGLKASPTSKRVNH